MPREIGALTTPEQSRPRPDRNVHPLLRRDNAVRSPASLEKYGRLFNSGKGCSPDRGTGKPVQISLHLT